MFVIVANSITWHTSIIKNTNSITAEMPLLLVSLPKNNTKNSYIILEENRIILKDVDGNILEEKII